MKKFISTLAVILSTVAVASCAVSAVQGVKAPTTQKGGLFGLVKQDSIKVDNDDAFKGADKVVIGSFKVGFFTEKDASSKAGRGFGGRASADVALNGVSDSLRQEITNAAYSDFVSQLKAKGIKIVDRKELTSDKDFAGSKTYDFPYDDGDIKYFSPAAIGNKSYFFMGESADFTGGFAFGNPTVAAVNYVKNSGVKVISALYVIDFVNTEGSGGSWASGATMEVGQGVSVTNGSKLVIVGGEGSSFSNPNGSIYLGQSIYSTKEFGTVKNTNSEAYVGAETALNIATTLMGAGSNQSRSFEITADAGKYKAAAMEAVKDTNLAVIGQFGNLK